jgi:hypothetical protein
MRNFNFLFLALVLSVPVAAFCQAGVTDPGTLKICAGVKDVVLPAGDRPTAAEAKALANCVSEDLYYGFEHQPDFVAARKCAYLEMDRGKNQPFAGKTILMMTYANGNGVPRNFDVALKLACEVPGGPGDVAGRVHQLARLKTYTSAHVKFSICDHASASYMYGQCAILDYRFDYPAREKTLDSIAASYTAPQKKAYEALRQAATAYFKVEAAKGIDLKASFEVHEKGFLERGLISSLQKFEKGDLPKFSKEEAAKAQKEMQAALDKALAQKPARNVNPEGLKETQKAWLDYREAWIRFGKARYRDVSETSWKGWLDDERATLLARAR